MELQLKRQIKSQCHPDEPIPPGDRRHFDFDAPGLFLRGRPWRAWLADEIRMANEPTAQVVTGLRGSGKTTELKQLQRLLEQEAYRVEYADVAPWLSDKEPVTTTDLLLAIVLALFPSGEPDQASGWVREYASQFAKLMGSTVSTTETNLSGIKAKINTDETVFQRVATHLKSRDGLREDVFTLLKRPVEAARKRGEEIVLILDGAEKRATGELDTVRRTEFHNAWYAAFVHQGRDLKPPLHTIYTVPPFMIRRGPEIAANFGCELQFLPMIRVVNHDGGLHEPGMHAVVDALAKRVDPTHFEDMAIMYWVAAWSGGYFRDLLRFMNYMIHAVGDEPRFTRAHAEYATDQVRHSYTQGLGLAAPEQAVSRARGGTRAYGRAPSGVQDVSLS